MRKLGVRFGAHYIYVPALLKPAARTLCAQLWALAQPGVDQEGAERLLHFAASGRTSFAVEPPTSVELCRVAGFRLCGDRAVRVDIVERLSDLIRAALPRSPAPGPADEADGFVVTGQMTSLTGCSGEPFASILRSLGFVPHQVKKSAHQAAIARRAAAAAAAPVAEVVAPPVTAEGETAPAAAEPVATEGATPVDDPTVAGRPPPSRNRRRSSLTRLKPRPSTNRSPPKPLRRRVRRARAVAGAADRSGSSRDRRVRSRCGRRRCSRSRRRGRCGGGIVEPAPLAEALSTEAAPTEIMAAEAAAAEAGRVGSRCGRRRAGGRRDDRGLATGAAPAAPCPPPSSPSRPSSAACGRDGRQRRRRRGRRPRS